MAASNDREQNADYIKQLEDSFPNPIDSAEVEDAHIRVKRMNNE